MASGIQRFILISVLAVAPVMTQAQDDPLVEQEPVLEPQIERERVREARIDAENFELGAYGGLISIENFGTNAVAGARLAYHVSEDVFFEGALAQSRAGETSFETLSGGVDLLDNDGRDYTYYNASVGYHLLPGESFLGSKRTFNTDFYLIGGAGITEFAGDNHFTVNVGMGYRMLLTDWLTLRMEMRDHIFDLDIFGENRTTQNLEWSLGLGGFF
jgi:outer membrane beta-barrel protein